MSLTTEKFDGTEFVEFDYIEDSVTVDAGLYRVQTVPTAKIETDATVDFSANQRVRVKDPNGTVFFAGRTASAGQYAQNGRKTVTVVNDAKRFVEDKISYAAVDQTPQEHLNQIESEADATFTIDYNSFESGSFEYGPDQKRVRRAIMDILDEADVVAYFEMDADVLVVDDRDTGGQFRDVSTEQDPILIQQFEEGSVETVRNAVTVVPSGGRGLIDAATQTDSTSISEYGRRAQTFNVESIYSQVDAAKFANSLLQPDPVASGKIQVAGGSDFYTELANQSIEVSDSTRDLSNRSLLISAQTIRPNRVILTIGDGSGRTSTQVNRGVQSSLETAKAGTEVDTDRLVDLSITETKIEDDSISTPKLQAEAVTANEILANSITAAQIDTLQLDTEQLTIGEDSNSPLVFEVNSAGDTQVIPDTAGTSQVGSVNTPFETIAGQDIQSTSQLTATTAFGTTFSARVDDADTSLNFVHTTDDIFEIRPSVATGSRNTDANLGNDTNYWNEVHAGNFITQTPDPEVPTPDLSKLSGLNWYNPPEYATRRKQSDGSYTRASPTKGVSIEHMSNWLLETCKAQQERIDDLESRVADLEQHISDSGGN